MARLVPWALQKRAVAGLGSLVWEEERSLGSGMMREVIAESPERMMRDAGTLMSRRY